MGQNKAKHVRDILLHHQSGALKKYFCKFPSTNSVAWKGEVPGSFRKQYFTLESYHYCSVHCTLVLMHTVTQMAVVPHNKASTTWWATMAGWGWGGQWGDTGHTLANSGESLVARINSENNKMCSACQYSRISYMGTNLQQSAKLPWHHNMEPFLSFCLFGLSLWSNVSSLKSHNLCLNSKVTA